MDRPVLDTHPAAPTLRYREMGAKSRRSVDHARRGVTVDIVRGVAARGREACALGDRDACGEKLLELARPGDRIVVMGARDDTLSEFAAKLLHELGECCVEPR